MATTSKNGYLFIFFLRNILINLNGFSFIYFYNYELPIFNLSLNFITLRKSGTFA